MKVSREGVILIKSFEGLRSRAAQRSDGRWVIGYGHTASAREGLSVNEADAELLLQYDLIPVVRVLNDQVAAALNQHQFDALASFVFSIGADRFIATDLPARLNAGETGQVADALAAWVDDSRPETPIRRRAAERALFVAAPDAPVALADLLSAPLPLPLPGAPLEPEPEAEPEVVATPAMDRETAVAALLGEPTEAGDELPVEPAAEPGAQGEPEVEIEPTVTTGTEVEAASAPAATPEPEAPPPPRPTTSAAFHLFSPYRVTAVGPLPGFSPLPTTPPPAPVEDAVAVRPVEAPPPFEVAAPEPVVTVMETPPAPVTTPVFTSTPNGFAPPIVRIETPTFAPAPTVSDNPVASAAAAFDQAQVGTQVQAPPLVLTSPDLSMQPAEERMVWPEAARGAEIDEPVLFDEAAALEHLAIRNTFEGQPPRRFDWSETGLFLTMGGIGLVSFGAAMAAFRRASETPGGGDTAMIGWVLAVIALACVSVSGFNLYQRWGRADRS